MTPVVERFLNWSRRADPAQRAEAAATLARAYLGHDLGVPEREAIDASLTMLLDDPALEVRLSLAEALADSEIAPSHLILALADDTPLVSIVVIARSPVILDSELVDRVGANDELIQNAIARRPFVSRVVSAALAEVGCISACTALMANTGANLPRFSVRRIIERHGDCAELRDALLDRKDLPLDLRQLLLARLAASLRALIVDREWLTPDRADLVTRDARERATINAAFDAPPASVPSLVEELIVSGDLTPAFLVRAAASGQADVFENALARLASMPPARVRALLRSGRPAAMRALLMQARLPPATFPVFISAAEVLRTIVHEDGSDYGRATRMIELITESYGRRRDRETDAILALLRRFVVEAKRAAAREVAQTMRVAA